MQNSLIANIFVVKNNKNQYSATEIRLLNFFCFLFLILPIAMIASRFAADFIVVISSIFFLFFSYKKKIMLYYKNKIILFLFLFWFLSCISSLLSADIALSLKSSFFYVRFIIFTCFVCFLLDNFVNLKKVFFYILFLSLLFVMIDSYFQFFFEHSIFNNPKPNQRLTGPFNHHQIVGSYISRLIPLLLFLYLSVHEKFSLKYLIIFSFVLSVVFFSGERTATFAAMLLIIALIIYIEKSFYKSIFYCFAFFACLLVLVLSVPSLKKRYVDQTITGFVLEYQKNKNDKKFYSKDDFINKEKKNFYIFSRSHEIHYRTALTMFLDKPFFGQGPNMFRVQCHKEKFYIEVSSCTTHPHNFPIQILAETGLAGFVFYVFSCLYFYISISKIFLKKLFNKNFNNDLNVKALLIYISFIINFFLFFLPNGNFFNNFLNIIMFLPLAFYLNFSNSLKSE